MLVREAERVLHRLLGLAALRDELGAQRLRVAGLVPGAALQHRGAAVPAPRHAEAGERLGQHRRLQRRLRPALAAVRRDHDLGDTAGPRIGDAGNLVVAGLLQGMAEGRVGDEGLHLLQEIEPVGLSVRQDLRVGARLVIGHRRLVGDLDAAQIFDVHVAFVARQQQAHRIAVARHQALAVLVERDHGVIERLLHRNAAAQGRDVGALRDEPFRRRLDAGLLEQGGELDAGPFGAGDEAVQHLRARLHRLVGKHRRAVAAAFEEGDACRHRIARERIEREDERLLDEPVDDETVLVGIDVGRAAMVADGEVQAVGRDRAGEQMMGRARMRGADLVLRIAQRAHHVLLEARRHLVGRQGLAGLQRPRLVLERLRGGAGERAGGARAQGAGKKNAASQQGAAVDQAISGDRLERVERAMPPSIAPAGIAHAFLPRKSASWPRLRSNISEAVMLLLCGKAVQGTARIANGE